MKAQLFYGIKLYDRNGKLTEERLKPAHSYTLQFLQIISAVLTFRTTNPSIKDISGVGRNVIATSSWDNPYYPFCMRYAYASEDTSRDGIIVGTGDTPETISDYAMDSLINSGDGVGELHYHRMDLRSMATLDYEIPASYFDFERSFFNLSGATITVKEIGLQVIYGTTAAGGEGLIARDVVTPIAIPAGGWLDVIYRFQFAD